MLVPPKIELRPQGSTLATNNETNLQPGFFADLVVSLNKIRQIDWRKCCTFFMPLVALMVYGYTLLLFLFIIHNMVIYFSFEITSDWKAGKSVYSECMTLMNSNGCKPFAVCRMVDLSLRRSVEMCVMSLQQLFCTGYLAYTYSPTP